MVNPGASLSLQIHYHRAEHWVVVSGTAEVTNGDEVTLLTENQSVYIPIGRPHRLSNPGKVPLEIIEVQTGTYLGEDDIVRLADGRQPNCACGPRRTRPGRSVKTRIASGQTLCDRVHEALRVKRQTRIEMRFQ